MKKILLALVVLISQAAIAQQLEVSSDTTICSSSLVTLSVEAQSLPNPIIVTDPTLSEAGLGLGDDMYTEIIPLGFSFDFYGNTYTECLISSNNYITFDLSNAGFFSAWEASAIPGGTPGFTGPAVDAIMAPWQDTQPPGNNGNTPPVEPGTIEYETIGTAPNRIFIVRFNNPLYGDGCGQCTSSSIYLYEGSNKIETHLKEKPFCTEWPFFNSGTAVHGIQNSNGTIAHIVTDPVLAAPRNYPLQWTASNEGWEFIPDPTDVNNYTINQIPFISTTSNNGIVWTDQDGTQVGTGSNISVSPTATTTYTVTVQQDCEATILSEDVSIFVSPEITITPTVVNNLCPGDNASIELDVAGGVAPLNYEWTSTNSFTSSNEDIYILAEGDYSVDITDAYDCEITAGPFSINPIPLPIQVTETIDPASCFGFADGTIVTSTVGGTPGYTYGWSSTNTFTDNGASITDLAAGDYTLNLTDNNGCTYSNTYNLPENSSLNISTNSSDYNGFNVRCYGGEDGWVSTTVSGGMLPYSFIWQNGIGDTVSNYTDLHSAEAGNYTLTITDAEECPAVVNLTLTQPDSLSIDVSNFQHKSCTYNSDGFIEVVTWGGPDTPPGSENFNPYTYRWNGPNFFYSYAEDIYGLENGLYELTTTDINDCVNTLTFEVNEPPRVVAEYHVMDDTVTINHPYMNIYDVSEGNIVGWDWEISNGFTSTSQDLLELNLATNLEEIGIKKYNLQLIVTDEFGCTDTTYGIIAIKDEHTLYVPNAFTPDLDSNNDEFVVYHHGMQEDTYELKIYDRYGSLVHKSNDPNASWDGTNDFTGSPLMTGVYTYYITYKDFEGHIYDHITCENCTGTISLMR